MNNNDYDKRSSKGTRSMNTATYGTHMIDLTEICKQVWETKVLEQKRNLLKRAIATFKYRDKADQFISEVEKADEKKCDFLASNLILNKTDKVVKPLPR